MSGRTVTPRVRLVSMAWGERYIETLFGIALPAILAPGNLPALAEQCDCEMVIVTEEAWFERLRARPIFRRLEDYCRVSLRPVDELVAQPDAYGVSLTYALFRGFEELGADMREVNLVFFNADFVMADGSLRSVARKIAAGERLIFAPSYCVVREDILPWLTGRRDENAGIIAIPPREMAEMGIRHRHNTIRGKTINQRLFSVEWMDQFYYLVDERTLLARQLPIAVVCMRPENVLTDMRTYWDYGIVADACPTAPRCVLGDSDDFLMIELRDADTARDQLALGWPTPQEIAAKLKLFITRDPIELARYPLVLHAGDLPDLEEPKQALARFVDAVLAALPDEPFDHIDHPNWVYHYARFHEARRDYLRRAGRLPAGEAAPTAPIAPAGGVSPASAPGPGAVASPPQRSLARRLARKTYGRLFGIAPLFQRTHPRWADVQPVLQAVANLPAERTLVVSSDQLGLRIFRSLPACHAGLTDIVGVPEEPAPASPPLPLSPVAEGANEYAFRLRSTDDFPVMVTLADGAERRARVTSLTVAWEDGEPRGSLALIRDDSEPTPAQSASAIARARRAPVKPKDAFPGHDFDVCLCELAASDLARLPAIVNSLVPRIRPGGSILIFHLLAQGGALADAQRLLIEHDALALDFPCAIRFTGSPRGVAAMTEFDRGIAELRRRRPVPALRGAFRLCRSALWSWQASNAPCAETGRGPRQATSVFIEISIARREPAMRPPATFLEQPRAAD